MFGVATVAVARIHLPLFAAGDLPTKRERYALLRAPGTGPADEPAGAASFTGMAMTTGYV